MLPSKTNVELNRRHFLSENAMGVGMVALATLLGEENLLGVPKNV